MLDRDKTGLLTINALLGREWDIMSRVDQFNNNRPIYALMDIDKFKLYNT